MRPAPIALVLALLPICAAAQSAGTATTRFEDVYRAERASEQRALKLGEWLELRGYLRMRGHLLNNLDLNRGEQPSSGEPIAPIPIHAPEINDTLRTADLRARLSPSLLISQEVGLHFQVDVLDNLVLGTSPEPSDAVAVKRAYADIITPIGLLTFGRMGVNWGLGMLANSGDGLDDDDAFTVDRVGFVTALGGHFLGVSYDFNADGPTTGSTDLDDADDTRTVSAVIAKMRPAWALRRLARADRWAFDYGLVGSHSWQDIAFVGAGDPPSASASQAVPRELRTWLVDVWLRLSGPTLRWELEGAYLNSRVADSSQVPGVSAPPIEAEQYGLVTRLDWRPAGPWLRLTAEAGLASGDPAPGFGTARPSDLLVTANGDLDGPQINLAQGDTRIDNFRFHPAFRVDEILWRRIIGQLTDAFYAKVGAVVEPVEGLEVDAAVIYSQAMEAASAPGLARPLGVEWDLTVRWTNRRGYHMGLTYALLAPLDGLANRAPERAPDLAHALRFLGAVMF